MWCASRLASCPLRLHTRGRGEPAEYKTTLSHYQSPAICACLSRRARYRASPPTWSFPHYVLICLRSPTNYIGIDKILNYNARLMSAAEANGVHRSCRFTCGTSRGVRVSYALPAITDFFMIFDGWHVLDKEIRFFKVAFKSAYGQCFQSSIGTHVPHVKRGLGMCRGCPGLVPVSMTGCETLK